jgi:hypothetical protein
MLASLSRARIMPLVTVDAAELVDLERYPIHDVHAPATIALAADCRARLDATGVAIVPGFVKPAAVAAMVAEADALVPGTHHQDLMGTPYLELPEDGWAPDHPRLAEGRSSLTAVAYDQFGPSSELRALYEWDPLMEFVALTLGKNRLFRYNDALGALNVASMADGDELFWHFDQTDFVVSIALRSSVAGGEFECVPQLRSADDERYDAVREVIDGRADTTTVPMEPGTLMFFAGRYSLHRVTPIAGPVARYVALLAYDTEPGTCSSELLRLVRYGRAEARA